MIHIIGASSLYHAFHPKNSDSDDQELIQLADQLRKYVISDRGVSLHPKAKNQDQTIQQLLLGISLEDSVIIWHDVINDTITSHPNDSRIPLTPSELLDEVRALPQINGIVYCQRIEATNVLADLRQLSIPVIEITTELISRKKQQNQELVDTYLNLHQPDFFELHSLEIIIKNYCNLSALLSKKRKQKPSKKQREKQREAKQQRLEGESR